MVSLQDIKQAITQLTPDEIAELRTYLDEQEDFQPALRTGTMDVDKLTKAARKIREGLSEEEWQEIEDAMNEEYIEPIDEDGFPKI